MNDRLMWILHEICLSYHENIEQTKVNKKSDFSSTFDNKSLVA